MERSNRLFEAIQLLRRAKRPMTADSLARKLEVTTRTIYRDIAALQAMHIPITGTAGVGYLMRPGFDLPPLMFTTDELEAIAVGLALVSRTGDPGLQRAAQSARDKIADVVPPLLQRTIRHTELYVSAYGIVPPVTVDLQSLRTAIRSERKLQLVYADDKGQVSTRTVLPLAITYFVEVAVLAAWCELRADFRHFRVDRISACAELDAFFQAEADGLRTRWRTHCSHQPPAPGSDGL